MKYLNSVTQNLYKTAHFHPQYIMLSKHGVWRSFSFLKPSPCSWRSSHILTLSGDRPMAVPLSYSFFVSIFLVIPLLSPLALSSIFFTLKPLQPGGACAPTLLAREIGEHWTSAITEDDSLFPPMKVGAKNQREARTNDSLGGSHKPNWNTELEL